MTDRHTATTLGIWHPTFWLKNWIQGKSWHHFWGMLMKCFLQKGCTISGQLLYNFVVAVTMQYQAKCHCNAKVVLFHQDNIPRHLSCHHDSYVKTMALNFLSTCHFLRKWYIWLSSVPKPEEAPDWRTVYCQWCHHGILKCNAREGRHHGSAVTGRSVWVCGTVLENSRWTVSWHTPHSEAANIFTSLTAVRFCINCFSWIWWSWSLSKSPPPLPPPAKWK